MTKKPLDKSNSIVDAKLVYFRTRNKIFLFTKQPILGKTCIFQVDIAGVECLAIRISYTGELGWEIYMPINSMKKVYKALMTKGKLVFKVVVWI